MIHFIDGMPISIGVIYRALKEMRTEDPFLKSTVASLCVSLHTYFSTKLFGRFATTRRLPVAQVKSTTFSVGASWNKAYFPEGATEKLSY
jgi:hypothetical protein